MFKLSEHILTPIDLYRIALSLLQKTTGRDIIKIAILIGLFVVFRNYFEWQTDSSLFMIFWIALFFWNLDSRISIGLGLISLIFCPILLYLHENNGFLMGEVWAEQMAVWAYYFLVIGVSKQIWEFRKESAEEEKNPETEEKTIKNVQFKSEQTPAPVIRGMNSEKARSIDEIIENIQRNQKQSKKQIQQKTNTAKQKKMMDIVPLK